MYASPEIGNRRSVCTLWVRQTHLFNTGTEEAMDRTAGQAEVKLGFLRRISSNNQQLSPNFYTFKEPRNRFPGYSKGFFVLFYFFMSPDVGCRSMEHYLHFHNNLLTCTWCCWLCVEISFFYFVTPCLANWYPLSSALLSPEGIFFCWLGPSNVHHFGIKTRPKRETGQIQQFYAAQTSFKKRGYTDFHCFLTDILRHYFCLCRGNRFGSSLCLAPKSKIPRFLSTVHFFPSSYFSPSLGPFFPSLGSGAVSPAPLFFS